MHTADMNICQTRFNLIVFNFMITRSAIPWMVLQPWESGIGGKTIPATMVLKNLKILATSLYLVCQQVVPVLPEVFPIHTYIYIYIATHCSSDIVALGLTFMYVPTWIISLYWYDEIVLLWYRSLDVNPRDFVYVALARHENVRRRCCRGCCCHPNLGTTKSLKSA